MERVKLALDKAIRQIGYDEVAKATNIKKETLKKYTTPSNEIIPNDNNKKKLEQFLGIKLDYSQIHKYRMNHKRSYRYWTEEEKEFLRNNCTTMSLDEISNNLGRPLHCVEIKAKTLGIKILCRRKKPDYNQNEITLCTKRCICTWYKEGDSIKDIGKILGRPREVIELVLEQCKENGNYDSFQTLKKQVR